MAAKRVIEEEPELAPNEEVIKTSFLDLLGIFFGFIWFMRRAIIGVILIAGLGLIIHNTWSNSRKALGEHRPVAVVENSSRVLELPETSIDFAPLNIGSSSDSATSNQDQPKSPGAEDNGTPKEAEFVAREPLLESGTADELVEMLLHLKNAWLDKNPTIGFMIQQRRLKFARRLLELEIEEHQRVFALNEYIESVIVLDLVVNQRKINAPQVRVALLEVVEKYQQHQSTTIRAKACLAGLAIPLHDYTRDRKGEALEEFALKLDKFAGPVFEDSLASAHLCSLVLDLRGLRDWDGVALPYCVKLVNKMADSSDPKIRSMSDNLLERIYFEHIGISDLTSRLDQGDKEVAPLIDEFFQGIEANPDIRSEFYQIAVSIIEKFKQLGQREEFGSHVQWLRKIVEKVSSKEKKAEIAKSIDGVQTIPWGAVEAEPKS